MADQSVDGSPPDTQEARTGIDYKGARLAVSLRDGRVNLWVNGVRRESAALPSRAGATALLTTSWQTDYEYHEWIEAYVRRRSGHLEVRLLANAVVILEDRIEIDKRMQ